MLRRTLEALWILTILTVSTTAMVHAARVLERERATASVVCLVP